MAFPVVGVVTNDRRFRSARQTSTIGKPPSLSSLRPRRSWLSTGQDSPSSCECQYGTGSCCCCTRAAVRVFSSLPCRWFVRRVRNQHHQHHYHRLIVVNATRERANRLSSGSESFNSKRTPGVFRTIHEIANVSALSSGWTIHCRMYTLDLSTI